MSAESFGHGRQSDSIDGDPDLEAARGAVASMKRLMKPTNRTGGPRYDMGNGALCPANPEHGKMFVLTPSGNEWCAHSDHTSKVAMPRG